MKEAPIPRVLTIAGSDSGGGAGIEADLKTFTALAVYGMAAITAVTAQNTEGIAAVHDVPVEMVGAQIDAVASDIGIDAVKTGMLGSGGIIDVVANRVRRYGMQKLVVDPVLVSTSGNTLLEKSAQESLKARLFPLAYLITPNLGEAETLTGTRISSVQAIHDAARLLHGCGAKNVLIKGGHMGGADATDYLYDGDRVHEFKASRIPTKDTHGTGCTLSAAIAAHLARGLNIQDAVCQAKGYVNEAIRRGFRLGKGRGPLNHFWAIERHR